MSYKCTLLTELADVRSKGAFPLQEAAATEVDAVVQGWRASSEATPPAIDGEQDALPPRSIAPVPWSRRALALAVCYSEKERLLFSSRR